MALIPLHLELASISPLVGSTGMRGSMPTTLVWLVKCCMSSGYKAFCWCHFNCQDLISNANRVREGKGIRQFGTSSKLFIKFITTSFSCTKLCTLASRMFLYAPSRDLGNKAAAQSSLQGIVKGCGIYLHTSCLLPSPSTFCFYFDIPFSLPLPVHLL